MASSAGALSSSQEPSEPTLADRLHDLFDREWEHRLGEDPLLATSTGRRGEHDARLPDSSLEAVERRAAAARGFLAELQELLSEEDPSAGQLDEIDRVSAEVFEWQLEQVVAEAAVHHARLPLTSDTGFQLAFARLPKEVPLSTASDFRDYAARLRAFPRWVDDHIGRLREGIESGMTMPRVTLTSVVASTEAQLVDDPSTSLFYAPFASLPASAAASESAAQALRAEGLAATRATLDGYRRFLEFLRSEYAPAAREEVGASSMPGGAAYYAQRVRHYTTLELPPETIYLIGLDEVSRIRDEMDAVLARLKDRGASEGGFEGTFEELLEFLRSDSRFYASTPQALMERAAFLSKKIDGRLPELFERLPRLPYGVEPVPAHIAPGYTMGRYVPGALDGSRAGLYWVNTHDLRSRPLYVLEALTLHEAVPGHHLQIALAQEMTDLPPFRRDLYISAYGEGWALYAERLGSEVGFYDDPYADFGRLTYEMWRACRLVVDTGLHAFGWSRDRAIDYLASNTALSLHEVETEIDRYISWPGQALSYKMGEITIRRLRAEAEEALGPRFDRRAFHDVILATGSVPLPVLERTVRRWVEAESARESTSADRSADAGSRRVGR